MKVSDTHAGRCIYYERVHCLLALASWAKRADPASFRLDEPPANAEHDLGRVLGQAFHRGCSLADAALATGLPPDRVIAIGKRTIRRTKWLSRIAADTDLAKASTGALRCRQGQARTRLGSPPGEREPDPQWHRPAPASNQR